MLVICGTPVHFNSTEVAAAASVPSSFTSIRFYVFRFPPVFSSTQLLMAFAAPGWEESRVSTSRKMTAAVPINALALSAAGFQMILPDYPILLLARQAPARQARKQTQKPAIRLNVRNQ